MSKAAALRAAVAAWRAALPDPERAAFLDRVAENAAAIAARDDALGPAARASAAPRIASLLGREEDAPEAALAEAIRTGALAPDDLALLDHLRRSALDELAIDQPRYRHGLARDQS